MNTYHCQKKRKGTIKMDSHETPSSSKIDSGETCSARRTATEVAENQSIRSFLLGADNTNSNGNIHVISKRGLHFTGRLSIDSHSKQLVMDKVQLHDSSYGMKDVHTKKEKERTSHNKCINDFRNFEKKRSCKQESGDFLTNLWGSRPEQVKQIQSKSDQVFNNDIYAHVNQTNRDISQTFVQDTNSYFSDTEIESDGNIKVRQFESDEYRRRKPSLGKPDFTFGRNSENLIQNEYSAKKSILHGSETTTFDRYFELSGSEFQDDHHVIYNRNSTVSSKHREVCNLDNNEHSNTEDGCQWSLRKIMEEFDREYPDEHDDGPTLQENMELLEIQTKTKYLLEDIMDFASSNNFEVKDTVPNGNCMFQSVNDQLRINGDIRFTATSLRQKAVEYLGLNPTNADGTHLECFLGDEESWVSYLSRMSQRFEWGDHLALKALSELLQRKIIVVNASSSEALSPHEIQPQTLDHVRNETLYLGHLGEFHYLSLRPKEWERSWVSKAKRNINLIEPNLSFNNMCIDQGPCLLFDSSATDPITKMPLLHLSFIITQLVDRHDICTLHIPARCRLQGFSGIIKTAGGKSDGTEVFLVHNNSRKHRREYYRRYDNESPLMIACHSEFDIVFHGNARNLSSNQLLVETEGIHPGYCILSSFDSLQNKIQYMTADFRDNEHDNRYDKLVQGFCCTEWPDCAKEWISRKAVSGWPSPFMKDIVTHDGCLLVKKSHPQSFEPYKEWQFIFPEAEKTLICEGFSRFQYYLFCLFKLSIDYSTKYLKQKLHNVHLKSVFFYACEFIPVSTFEKSPGGCFLYLIEMLAKCLKEQNLPNYFVRENNMIDHYEDENIRELLDCVESLRLFPVQSFVFLVESQGYRGTWIVELIEKHLCQFSRDQSLHLHASKVFFPTMIRRARKFAIEKQFFRAYMKVLQAHRLLLVTHDESHGQSKHVPTFRRLLEDTFEVLDDYTKCLLADEVERNTGICLFRARAKIKRVKDLMKGQDVAGYGSIPIPETDVGDIELEGSFLNGLGVEQHNKFNNYENAALLYQAAIDHLQQGTVNEIKDKESGSAFQERVDHRTIVYKCDTLSLLCFKNLFTAYGYLGKVREIEEEMPVLESICLRLRTAEAVSLVMEIWDKLGQSERGVQIHSQITNAIVSENSESV